MHRRVSTNDRRQYQELEIFYKEKRKCTTALSILCSVQKKLETLTTKESFKLGCASCHNFATTVGERAVAYDSCFTSKTLYSLF